MRAPTTSQRVVALDGLRGLAALAVVLGHSLGAIDIPGVYGRAQWVHSPLAVAINAIGAGNQVCGRIAASLGQAARPSHRFADGERGAEPVS